MFPIEYANRLKELLPHAEGPKTYDRAAHFLQDDRGPGDRRRHRLLPGPRRGSAPVNFVDADRTRSSRRCAPIR